MNEQQLELRKQLLNIEQLRVLADYMEECPETVTPDELYSFRPQITTTEEDNVIAQYLPHYKRDDHDLIVFSSNQANCIAKYFQIHQFVAFFTQTFAHPNLYHLTNPRLVKL